VTHPRIPSIQELMATPAERTARRNAARFDAILDLEQAARITAAVYAFRTGPAAPGDEDRRRLYAALDALTPEERAAFGEYRRATFGESRRAAQ
jgi:hypothetical protein